LFFCKQLPLLLFDIFFIKTVNFAAQSENSVLENNEKMV